MLQSLVGHSSREGLPYGIQEMHRRCVWLKRANWRCPSACDPSRLTLTKALMGGRLLLRAASRPVRRAQSTHAHKCDSSTGPCITGDRTCEEPLRSLPSRLADTNDLLEVADKLLHCRKPFLQPTCKSLTRLYRFASSSLELCKQCPGPFVQRVRRPAAPVLVSVGPAVWHHPRGV